MASKAAATPPRMPRSTVTKTSVSAVAAQQNPNQHPPPAHPHQEQHPGERFRRPTSHLESLGLRVVKPNSNPDGGEGANEREEANNNTIVQPWDAGFHQAAQDLNRRVIQQLLEGIDAQEATIKKKAAGDTAMEDDGERDGEGEGIGDDNDNDEDKMAPKDETTDADANTAIIEKVGDDDNDDADANATKALMQQLQTQRDILSSLRIPTAETLSVMERCFASFLHVFCPPSSSEVAKELKKQQIVVTNNHASSSSTTKKKPSSADNDEDDENDEEEDETIKHDPGEAAIGDSDLHHPVPWSLVEEFWSRIISAESSDSSDDDDDSSMILRQCPNWKAVLDIMKMIDAQSHYSDTASLPVAAKSDNDNVQDHTSASVPIKRFLAYIKQSLKEAHAIVEMDAPRLDTADESSDSNKETPTFIQLKQSAANQQWPAKFVAQYASNHHVHVHDNGNGNVNVEGSTTTTAAASGDVHVHVSGTPPLSMPTLKHLMHTMRADSFRANQSFVTLLDEILVQGEDTHNHNAEEEEKAARRYVMDQDRPDKEVVESIGSIGSGDDANSDETKPESGQTADIDNDLDETQKEDDDEDEAEASSFWMCLASPSAKRQQQQHKKQKQLYQSFQLLYAIEHLATHSFQMIASLLNMASSSASSSSSSEEKAHQTWYVSAKERLSYWLMNHQNKFLFLKWRLSLYMNDNKEEPERQLLENGLLYLDACTRLLHLTIDTNKSPLLDRWAKQKQEEGSKDEDEDEKIMTAFVKVHARLEQYLSLAWNRQVKPLLSDSTTHLLAKQKKQQQMENSQHQQGNTHAVEGTLALRKRRYQKIIDEYRRRQRDRGRLIAGHDAGNSYASASSAQPGQHPKAQAQTGPAAAAASVPNTPPSPSQEASGVDVALPATSPSSPEKESEDEGDGDGDFLSWSPKKAAPPPTPTAEGEETPSLPQPDKDEGQDTASVHEDDGADDEHHSKDHCDYMLKVAIGIGRVMHSTAMSLGRNTLEFSIAVDVNVNGNHKNPAWTAKAVDLEQRLYDASLSIFGMIATYQEQNAHAQFPSVAAAAGGQESNNMNQNQQLTAEHHLHSSDMFVQNQLDIADTLSCLGYVQDTKREQFRPALSSYERAVEIYSFFMGDKSEAAEKAWHNVGILHVALSSTYSSGQHRQQETSQEQTTSQDSKDAEEHVASSITKTDAQEEEKVESKSKSKDRISGDGGDDDHDKKESREDHLQKSLAAWRHVLTCQHHNHGGQGEGGQKGGAVAVDYALEVANTMEYIGQVFEMLPNEEDETLGAFGNALLQVKRVLEEKKSSTEDGNVSVSSSQLLLSEQAKETRDRVIKKLCPHLYRRKNYDRIVQLIGDLYVGAGAGEGDTETPTQSSADEFYRQFHKGKHNMLMLLMAGVAYFKSSTSTSMMEEATLCLATYLSARGCLVVQLVPVSQTKSDTAEHNKIVSFDLDHHTDSNNDAVVLAGEEMFQLSNIMSDGTTFSLEMDKLKKVSDNTIEALFSLGTILQTTLVERTSTPSPSNTNNKDDAARRNNIEKGKELLELWNVLYKAIASKETENDERNKKRNDNRNLHSSSQPLSLYRAHIHFYRGELNELVLKQHDNNHDVDNKAKAFHEYTCALKLFQELQTLHTEKTRLKREEEGVCCW
jgi:hypothetical protein